MKTILLLLFLPCALWGFTPKAITPFPVIGYKEIPFYDDLNLFERQILVWYPIKPAKEPSKPVKETSKSAKELAKLAKETPFVKNPWDVFEVVEDAPVLYSRTNYPVIILSHGYTGNPHQLSWLINGLVQNGFIVIALQHMDVIDGKAHVNHWRRPLDIRIMLDAFSESDMVKYADMGKVAIGGFSLGGTTAIWVAGGRSTKLDTLIPGPEFSAPDDYTYAEEALPTLNKGMMSKDWRDKRVKSAFVMAPAWSWLFDEASLKKITIPVYLIAAAEDKVLVTKKNAGFFAHFIPKAFFREIPGKGNHFIFISMLSEAQRKNADPKQELQFLFVENAAVDRPWIQAQVIEEATRFFTWSFQKNLDSVDDIGRRTLDQIIVPY